MTETPRAEMVQSLVEAAMTGMDTTAQDASASEVVSACFTMAVRALHVSLDMGADRAQLRIAVGALLLELAEPEMQ